MIWREVKSSNIQAVTYHSETKELRVRFSTGAVYSYAGVPESIYRALLEAPSVGSFVHKQIRPVYAATRVEVVETKSA